MIPLHLLVAALFGWLEREQRDVIEFLREENRVLKRQLHGRRLRLCGDERRRLAVLDERLGRRVLAEVTSLVTPDTILRWHGELIARKWTSDHRATDVPGCRPGAHPRYSAQQDGRGEKKYEGRHGQDLDRRR